MNLLHNFFKYLEVLADSEGQVLKAGAAARRTLPSGRTCSLDSPEDSNMRKLLSFAKFRTPESEHTGDCTSLFI